MKGFLAIGGCVIAGYILLGDVGIGVGLFVGIGIAAFLRGEE